jgi:hypothetical protein
MQTNNTLTGIELVKELNSKRTQGIWDVRKYGDGIRVYSNTFGCISKTPHEGKHIEEHEANADYTVLAVQNFASVVDALNEIKMVIELTNGKNTSIVELQLNKINQALNNIKL